MSAASLQPPSRGPRMQTGSGAPDAWWIPAHRPRQQAAATRSSSNASSLERSERVNAAIVIVLTIACTVMAMFDLFLLASGS